MNLIRSVPAFQIASNILNEVRCQRVRVFLQIQYQRLIPGALGLICRASKAEDWPTAALPLLFGLGAAATRLVFSLDLDPRIGANPAYSTVMLVAAVLATLWWQRKRSAHELVGARGT